MTLVSGSLPCPIVSKPSTDYGDDFSDYVEFASENYGDGSLADTNNNNLGNTPEALTPLSNTAPSASVSSVKYASVCSGERVW
jgi:hypothetical protein